MSKTARYTICFNLDNEVENKAYEIFESQRGWGKKGFVIRAILHEGNVYEEALMNKAYADLLKRVEKLEKKGGSDDSVEGNLENDTLDGILEFIKDYEG